MIGAHPGGTALTRRLLELAAAKPPARILDLGAGAGESVDFLRQQGFEADGIDRTAFLPRGKVMAGDMRALSFPDASYDLCMAECSISVCGDGPGVGAGRESAFVGCIFQKGRGTLPVYAGAAYFGMLGAGKHPGRFYNPGGPG